MTGNRVAHPLLISLANIAADLRLRPSNPAITQQPAARRASPSLPPPRLPRLYSLAAYDCLKWAHTDALLLGPRKNGLS